MTKEEIEKLADKWYNKHGSISPSVIEKTAFIVGYKAAYQETERLKAELNELKEKHKMNAVNFADFICLSGYTLMQKNISENGAMFFINENSIGVCSSELYEQYYKQKFESND